MRRVFFRGLIALSVAAGAASQEPPDSAERFLTLSDSLINAVHKLLANAEFMAAPRAAK